jgi:hypothetical protein
MDSIPAPLPQPSVITAYRYSRRNSGGGRKCGSTNDAKVIRGPLCTDYSILAWQEITPPKIS